MGEAEPTYRVCTWIWRGNVVLDYDGVPMRDFRALPATLSSLEDGCFLEGMCREDPRISWKDLRARFPVRHSPMTNPKPVFLATAIAMKRGRYRASSACIAWKPRQGSDDLRAQIQALLPRQCLRANSTRSLTNKEFEAIEEVLNNNKPDETGNSFPSKGHGERQDETKGKAGRTSKRKAEGKMGNEAKKAQLEQVQDDTSEIIGDASTHRKLSAPMTDLEKKLQGYELPRPPTTAYQSFDGFPEYTNNGDCNDLQLPLQYSTYGIHYETGLSTIDNQPNDFPMTTGPYQNYEGRSHLLDEESTPIPARIVESQSPYNHQSKPCREVLSNTPLPDTSFLQSRSSAFEEEATDPAPSWTTRGQG